MLPPVGEGPGWGGASGDAPIFIDAASEQPSPIEGESLGGS
jgi:hypothetical protein